MSRQSVLKRQWLLLVEDEPGLVMTLSDLLREEGYYVKSATDGQTALNLASNSEFDAIVLDIMLPDINGFDVCRTLRLQGVRTPILMLTARSELEDRVKGLNRGADDYLVKPFEMPELLARLQALIRRASFPPRTRTRQAYEFDSVVVDFWSAQVHFGGKRVELSAREFELLCYFIEHHGTPIPRRQLLSEVWGYDSKAQTRTIDVHFGLLRQKLEHDPKNPRHFLTVRGFGYKFVG